jgi:hypothetical protein
MRLVVVFLFDLKREAAADLDCWIGLDWRRFGSFDITSLGRGWELRVRRARRGDIHGGGYRYEIGPTCASSSIAIDEDLASRQSSLMSSTSFMGTNLVTVRVDLVGDACKPTAQDLRLMRRMVFASTEGTEVMRTLLAPCLAVDAPQPMLGVTRSVCGRRARGSDKARGVDDDVSTRRTRSSAVSHSGEADEKKNK